MQARSHGTFEGSKEEPDPSEGETIEEADRDEEGEPAWTTSPADQSFKEALYGWTQVPKDSGKSLPMADDSGKFHVVLVMYPGLLDLPTRTM